MSYGTVQAEKVTTESGYSLGAGNASSFKNRVINGRMDIDQRNAGASVSISNTTKYSVDRFPISNVSDGVVSAQQSSTAPSGFKNSLKITVTTADASVGATQYAFIRHIIEGYNVADFGLGAAGAVSFTISFWVQSSVTGTFGGAIQNAGESRAYAFTYTINAANTWEQKTITVAGDTSGTWATDNTAGLILNLSLGVGSTYSSTANTWVSQTSFNASGSVALLNTLNATFYVTGVQLEVGTVATSFDYRPYGTELALCQRYFETSYAPGTAVGTATDVNTCMWLSNRNPGTPHTQLRYIVPKRATASVAIYSSAAANTSGIYNIDGATTYTPTFGRDGNMGGTLYTGTSVALGNFLQYHYTASAEL